MVVVVVVAVVAEADAVVNVDMVVVGRVGKSVT